MAGEIYKSGIQQQTEDVSGNSGDSLWVRVYDNSNNIRFNTTENDGKVGIGTDNPLYKLHVVGDIFSTGNIEATGDINFTGNILRNGADFLEALNVNEKKQTLFEILTQQPQTFTLYGINQTAGFIDISWNYSDILAYTHENILARLSNDTRLKNRHLPFINTLKIEISGNVVQPAGSTSLSNTWIEYYSKTFTDNESYLDISNIRLIKTFEDDIIRDACSNILSRHTGNTEEGQTSFDIRIYGINYAENYPTIHDRALYIRDISFVQPLAPESPSFFSVTGYNDSSLNLILTTNLSERLNPISVAYIVDSSATVFENDTLSMYSNTDKFRYNNTYTKQQNISHNTNFNNLINNLRAGTKYNFDVQIKNNLVNSYSSILNTVDPSYTKLPDDNNTSLSPNFNFNPSSQTNVSSGTSNSLTNIYLTTGVSDTRRFIPLIETEQNIQITRPFYETQHTDKFGYGKYFDSFQNYLGNYKDYPEAKRDTRGHNIVTIGPKTSSHPFSGLGSATNAYYINGKESPNLIMIKGLTYRFMLEDLNLTSNQNGGLVVNYNNSNNTTDASGSNILNTTVTNSNGISVTFNSTAGAATAFIEITPNVTGRIYYGSANANLNNAGTINQNFTYMGNFFMVVDSLELLNTPNENIVKVVSKTNTNPYYETGSLNTFTINDTEAPVQFLLVGQTYDFDQNDSSNTNHPLKFYKSADKSGGALGSSDGVSYNIDNPGTLSENIYTRIVVNSSHIGKLYYQCGNHSYMGHYFIVTDLNLDVMRLTASISADDGSNYTMYQDISFNGFDSDPSFNNVLLNQIDNNINNGLQFIKDVSNTDMYEGDLSRNGFRLNGNFKLNRFSGNDLLTKLGLSAQTGVYKIRYQYFRKQTPIDLSGEDLQLIHEFYLDDLVNDPTITPILQSVLIDEVIWTAGVPSVKLLNFTIERTYNNIHSTQGILLNNFPVGSIDSITDTSANFIYSIDATVVNDNVTNQANTTGNYTYSYNLNNEYYTESIIEPNNAPTTGWKTLIINERAYSLKNIVSSNSSTITVNHHFDKISYDGSGTTLTRKLGNKWNSIFYINDSEITKFNSDIGDINVSVYGTGTGGGHSELLKKWTLLFYNNKWNTKASLTNGYPRINLYSWGSSLGSINSNDLKYGDTGTQGKEDYAYNLDGVENNSGTSSHYKWVVFKFTSSDFETNNNIPYIDLTTKLLTFNLTSSHISKLLDGTDSDVVGFIQQNDNLNVSRIANVTKIFQPTDAWYSKPSNVSATTVINGTGYGSLYNSVGPRLNPSITNDVYLYLGMDNSISL